MRSGVASVRGDLPRLSRRGQGEFRLAHPASLVGRALPALQGDAADAAALLAVEDLGEGVGVAGLDVRSGAAHVEQTLAAVRQDGQRAPALELQLGR